MGQSISKSIDASSTKSGYVSATSMVVCNSGLSWFDHPVNRENRNVVVNLLQDLRMPIIAVWLVSRPINSEIGSGSFEHWCVKIQAKGCLISIDFLESSGMGAFGLQQRTDVGAELEDFLFYGLRDKQTGARTRHKWEIISSVTPHPFRNAQYLNFLSDHDRLKLEQYIKNSKIAPKDPSKFLKDIQCKRRVSDIAEFAALWTADNRGYNPITKNCQQFAAQLFAYLVGMNYRDECERVFERYQSPFDQREWKNGKAYVESITIQNQNEDKNKYKTIMNKHKGKKQKQKRDKVKRHKPKSMTKSLTQKSST